MLFADALRGTDATGVMYGDKHNNVQVHKAGVPSWEFLATKEWDSTKSAIIREGTWIFGHNRAATRGAKDDKGAHPFQSDHVVLMQNGTYHGDHTALEQTDVDTEACAITIAKNEDVEEALQKIDAAYAFVWWNHKEKSLNIIRNDERPLHWAQTKTGGIFFASEASLITLAAARNNVDLVGSSPAALAEASHTKYVFKEGGDWELFSTSLDITPKKAPRTSFFPVTSSNRPGWKVHTGGTGTADKKNIHLMLDPADGFRSLSPTHRTILEPRDFNSLKNLIIGTSTTVFCEAIDYLKVYPNNPDDTLYYVYAVITSAVSGLDGHIVYWRKSFDSELEAINCCSSGWYSVDLTYARELRLAGELYTLLAGMEPREVITQ